MVLLKLAQTIVGTNKYRLEKVGPIAILIFAGVVAIFGPGTSVAKATCQIMEIMLED